MRIDNTRVKGVGAILINKKGEYLLQKRTLDAPNNAGLIANFGGGREGDESPVITLARELKEEIELDIETNGNKPVYINAVESRKTPGMFHQMYLITNIDDSNLILHEGEAIVKVKKLADIPDSKKSYGLRQITDEMIQKLL